MQTIKIKPLSVNEAWQGRRFKTRAYKQYIVDCMYLLPKLKIPPGPLSVTLTFGFSNSASDIDNPAKCFIDILQKKYGFNDAQIYWLTINKSIVKKGAEFVAFSVVGLDIFCIEEASGAKRCASQCAFCAGL